MCQGTETNNMFQKRKSIPFSHAFLSPSESCLVWYLDVEITWNEQIQSYLTDSKYMISGKKKMKP